MWKVKIITAYPDFFPGILGCSVIGKALEKKIWGLETINLHDFTSKKISRIDDTPFGGGPGMIIRPDIIEKAVLKTYKETLDQNNPLIFMTPTGRPLKQKKLENYAKKPGITILCGRFEGVDARVLENFNFELVSVGDYVLSGGEVAAQLLVEGCVRLLPGVLGHSESVLEESFSKDFLEHPQYTKPQVWVDRNNKKNHVPDILLSGHHEKINKWRKDKSVEITKKNRQELIKNKKI